MAGALVPEDDLYARLEVETDASSEAIELAWRALLKQHHPDVAGDDAAALERAKRINVAHDWLSDPSQRARYDRERLGLGAIPAVRARTGVRHGRPPRAWPPQPAPRPASGARARRSTRPDLVRGEPAERMARFLDRVARLTPDELDRLAAAEPPPIAFLATVRRFVTPDAAAAFEAAETALAVLVPHDRWTEVGLREGLLGVAAELVLSAFLDDTLAEPFRGRARDRLLRAWEASIDQPRYGPNGAEVLAVRARTALMTPAEVALLIRASAGVPGEDRPWPPALDPGRGRGAADLRPARGTRRRCGPAAGRARPGDRRPGPAAAGAHRPRDRPAPRLSGDDLRRARRAVPAGDRDRGRPERRLRRARKRRASGAPADERVAAARLVGCAPCFPVDAGLAALLTLAVAACASATPSAAPATVHRRRRRVRRAVRDVGSVGSLGRRVRVRAPRLPPDGPTRLDGHRDAGERRPAPRRAGRRHVPGHGRATSSASPATRRRRWRSGPARSRATSRATTGSPSSPPRTPSSPGCRPASSSTTCTSTRTSPTTSRRSSSTAAAG